MEKILRPLEAGVLDYITYMSPNLAELRSIYHAITGSNVKATSTTGTLFAISRYRSSSNPILSVGFVVLLVDSIPYISVMS